MSTEVVSGERLEEPRAVLRDPPSTDPSFTWPEVLALSG